jgi:hypothetical protein
MEENDMRKSLVASLVLMLAMCVPAQAKESLGSLYRRELLAMQAYASSFPEPWVVHHCRYVGRGHRQQACQADWLLRDQASGNPIGGWIIQPLRAFERRNGRIGLHIGRWRFTQTDPNTGFK